MWTVVCMGSLAGWRNSSIRRAPRSSRVDSAASTVTSQPLAIRLTRAGGSEPRSWVAGPGWIRGGRVIRSTTPYRPIHAATGPRARAISNIRRFTLSVLEPDLDRTALALRDFEERPGLEAHHAGDDVARDRLGGVVVGLHGAVVELPRVGDL